MRLLEKLVGEYKERYLQEEHFEHSLSGEIKRVQKALLDERFMPSLQLKSFFDKLLRRSNYPMEVAIVGQFSSGKSTFLNALLSKDVLPTGITPVTSKVNYINYAQEYKLKVSYNNGVEEYHALETISSFTDQRKAVEDIKYLTLYAPMEILKEISFVDTPGLNSQSTIDTQVTRKILRDVDGIIWLTLIDNAGKESEAEILNEYLGNYKEKSLCVLNQKDKFTPSEIESTVAYMKERFGRFFTKVIPISAKQALDSRVNQKEVLAESALHRLQKDFVLASQLNHEAKDLSFFEEHFNNFSVTMEQIRKKDSANDQLMMRSSNLSEVLSFIDQTIRPQAAAAKAFAIEKDLSAACDILIKEYETLLAVYESLETILVQKEDEILTSFERVSAKHTQGLNICYEKMEGVLETIAEAIYQHITQKDAIRYEERTTLWREKKVVRCAYQTLLIEGETIMQKLFYDDQAIDKRVKGILAHFKGIELQSSEDFREVFGILKDALQGWQKPYELIKKHREIASDLEFATVRQFVAKVYENVILAYHRAIWGNITALHKKFAFFSGAFGYTYRQITQESILMIQERISKQIKAYEYDPLKYTLTAPGYETILELVRKNFEMEKAELFLRSRRNYLYKIIEVSKTQFSQINSEKRAYVISEKNVFIEKIKEIRSIQQDMRRRFGSL